ncbi:MAG: hypothetical protein LBL63_00825 [Clostridiales Family XIII bacterium]|jgi:hypothetical protein|nr:hypothetical protein [Clostridiales Family XIII bacterium]
MRNDFTASLDRDIAAPNKPGAKRARRTKREMFLLSLLIAVVVIVAFLRFLLLPMMDELSARRDRVEELGAREAEMRAEIATAKDSREQYDQSASIFDGYRLMLAAPMDKELLDTTITQLLLRSGYEPQTLKLSDLRDETITFYKPEKSEASLYAEPAEGTVESENPADKTGEEADETGDAETDADGNGDAETSADGSGYEETGAPAGSNIVSEPEASDARVLSYTIEAEVLGGRECLYRLIEELRGLTAIKLASYRIDNPRTPSGDRDGRSSATARENVATLRFDIYVFDEVIFEANDDVKEAT